MVLFYTLVHIPRIQPSMPPSHNEYPRKRLASVSRANLYPLGKLASILAGDGEFVGRDIREARGAPGNCSNPSNFPAFRFRIQGPRSLI